MIFIENVAKNDREKKIQLIAFEVIKVLKRRFDNFPREDINNRNAPFHEAFLRAFKNEFAQKNITDTPFLISLASWLHGLNTTLGQSFFESVAHILSDGEKRSFKEHKIKESQQKAIMEIITDLKNGTRKPNPEEENKAIFSWRKDDKEVDAQDFTADNLVITSKFVEAIEIKSVRPNAGEMRAEKQKILMGKAVLKNLYPDRDISFFIGFPFDPLSENPTGHDKKRFMDNLIEFNKYFAPEEVLLASEFWDKLSGTSKTMELILKIINDIAKPDFMKKFYFINDPQNFNKNKQKYLEILEEWKIMDEIKIFKKLDVLKQKGINERLLYLSLFDDDGNYNSRRELLLKAL